MRVVLGSEGLLGREFVKLGYVGYNHDDCDITNTNKITDIFHTGYGIPEAVVNCVGIVRGKIDRYSPEQVVRVNSLAPHILARECEFFRTELVHISTDCVFSGCEFNHHYETSQPTPDDFYSITKLAGEIKGTTIRTSFIGLGGGLLEWAKSQESIVGYDYEFWNGLTTREVAKFVDSYLNGSVRYPLLHLGGLTYSKYEVLTTAAKVFGWNTKIAQGPTPKNRKRYRVLGSKYIPGITKPLMEMLEELK